MVANQTKFSKNLISYRSRRGMKELDLILEKFTTTQFVYLNSELQHQYASLLEQPDTDLWNWVTGQEFPPSRWQEIISKIIVKT